MARQNSIAAWAIVIIALLGLLNASFLAYRYYEGTPPPCTINGCDVVTTSRYAEVAGVSVALIGAFYYLALVALSTTYCAMKRGRALMPLLGLSGAGVLASAWFVYLQLFVIRAICIYCMFSALDVTIIFLLSLFLIRNTATAK